MLHTPDKLTFSRRFLSATKYFTFLKTQNGHNKSALGDGLV